MRKYLVINEYNGGDTEVYVFDSLEAANKEADRLWDHLTDREKRKEHIFVAHVEDTKQFLDDYAWDEEEGTVDFRCYHSCDWDEGYFNSETIREASEEEGD